VNRQAANELAFERLIGADPVLVGVKKAGELPGFQPNMILTSGAPMPWSDYTGLQRKAIRYGAVWEGLADSAEDADRKIAAGEIVLATTHGFGCAGVHAGIYTASMSMFVVEERATGTLGYCHFFEGNAPRRLGFGFYGDDVVAQLRFVEDVLAPTIGEAVRRAGGIALQPIASRALHFGDELHGRTIAGTLLLTRALLPALFELSREREAEVRRTLQFLETADHFFYRVWMAACKATTQAASGIEGSSLVTAMTFNSREFAVQVSGLGDAWFRGPHPRLEARYLAGRYAVPDGNYTSGSDCMFSECVGLGAFASAAAFMLQGYQGISPQQMVERTLSMYEITHGEHPVYGIPFLANRGVPIGIDVFKVVETGVLPIFEGIIVSPDGTLTGTGVARPPMECFERAVAAHRERYGAG
jgi:hypothetical protein